MEGNVVQDFKLEKILNYNVTNTSLSEFQKELTVIDFFGTWCAPCMRALPHLSALQNQFAGKIAFMLVSTEEEAKLSAFIQSRKGFTLPVIVDKDNKITNLFQPPSYPYTIVINRKREIISISNAATITEEKLSNWLKNPELEKPLKVLPGARHDTAINNQTKTIIKSNNPLVKLSQEFIYAAKTGDVVSAIMDRLNKIKYDDLVKKLSGDEEKKAFWINIYNGSTQYLLKQNKDVYKSRSAFYKKKQIAIGGKLFSLDDIEHGILRRSKIKWSEGYLNKLFPSATEKELRVSRLDYRIHFALNCGAESCPPIAFYNPENLDYQLDAATSAYLLGEAKYDSSINTLELPRLMSWFRHDFGGKKQMNLLAKKLGIVPANKNPSIKFKEYNWNLYLDNYKN